jgi:hypothetical protein
MQWMTRGGGACWLLSGSTANIETGCCLLRMFARIMCMSSLKRRLLRKRYLVNSKLMPAGSSTKLAWIFPTDGVGLGTEARAICGSEMKWKLRLDTLPIVRVIQWRCTLTNLGGSAPSRSRLGFGRRCFAARRFAARRFAARRFAAWHIGS